MQAEDALVAAPACHYISLPCFSFFPEAPHE